MAHRTSPTNIGLYLLSTVAALWFGAIRVQDGALSIGDPADAEAIEQLRFHGIRRDVEGNIDVDCVGGKFNLPDVNARVGIEQLRRLDAFNAQLKTLKDSGELTRLIEPFGFGPETLPPADMTTAKLCAGQE